MDRPIAPRRLPSAGGGDAGGAGPRDVGFTLLELLVALAIMSTAMGVIVSTFVVTLKGWQRGSDLLDDLHHGDFVMEQLTSALRSSAYFYNKPELYGFWLEDEERGDYPTDKISFVTSGTAFVPIDSPFANGLHRLEVAIDENEDGELGVAVRAIPHLVNVEDWEEEPWFVSLEVKGLECRTYNPAEEDWEDQWETSNAVPSLVEITLFMDPLEDGGDPLTISRVIEIPVAPVVANAVRFQEEDREDAEEVAAEGGEIGEVIEGPDGETIEVRGPGDRSEPVDGGGLGLGRGGGGRP